jgi:cytochrome d ubiquinol oxidase subunit I
VLISLIILTGVYGVLAVIELRLFTRTISAGLPDLEPEPEPDSADKPLSYAY